MAAATPLSRPMQGAAAAARCAVRPRPAFRPFAAAAARPCATSSSSLQQQQRRGQQQRLCAPPRAAEQAGEQSVFNYDEPETAREAIDLGLVLCKQNNWAKALEVFEKGLNLPGTGVKRFRDKPRLISDGERQAALYNIACCHSRLEDARSGLVALSGCIELGYSDYAQIRADPDLAFLRSDPRFEGLMERFQKKAGGFLGLDLGSIFGNKS